MGFELEITPPDPLDAEIRAFFKEEAEKTPTTTDLARDILMHKQAIQSVELDISEQITRRVNIDKEISRLQAETNKKIQDMMELKKEINEKLYDLRKEQRKLSDELRQLERSMELELDKIRQSMRFKMAVTEYDIATAGLYWRDKAKQHQLEGAQILANAGSGILADKMGLGKTLTSLIAADMLDIKRLLIVCQGDITNNFANEARIWAPHRAVANLYKMTKGQRDSVLHLLKMSERFTVLINYDSWRRDKALVERLSSMGFQSMILDEGHNVKNSDTSAFKGVRDIRMAENCCPKCSSLKVEQFEIERRRYALACSDCDWRSNDLSFTYKPEDRRSVKHVWFATGTPILNRPQELYTALCLIIPGVFQSESQYLSIYCEQDYSGYWKWKEGGLDSLQTHLAGRYLCRDRKTLESQGIFLPKQQVIYHDIEMDEDKYPLQSRIIKQLAKSAQFILESGRTITMFHTLELITRQRQANVWPGGIKIKDPDGNVVYSVDEEVRESIKVDWAVKLLDEFFTDNRRSVVFSQFTGPLHELKSRLDQLGIRAVVYDGSTPQKTRSEIATDFDRTYCERDGYETKWDVVLANYRTGGTGLNFTAATCTVVTDEEWNPGKNEQAWGRTDRIGQTEENYVHICRLSNSIDDWMAKLLEHKRAVVNGFAMSAAEMQEEMLKALRGQ